VIVQVAVAGATPPWSLVHKMETGSSGVGVGVSVGVSVGVGVGVAVGVGV
jgi:hypothetical protein